jgi:hypothetical protein
MHAVCSPLGSESLSLIIKKEEEAKKPRRMEYNNNNRPSCVLQTEVLMGRERYDGLS